MHASRGKEAENESGKERGNDDEKKSAAPQREVEMNNETREVLNLFEYLSIRFYEMEKLVLVHYQRLFVHRSRVITSMI